MINRFNLRVYGILLNHNGEVLLVHEKIGDFEFIKFPGGGLEFGEGTHECLIREFKEEAGIDIHVQSHLYTTDFFQASAFKPSDQLISIYYQVGSNATPAISLEVQEITTLNRIEWLRFFWVPLHQLTEQHLTFPIDKLMVQKIKQLAH
ncbi:MAG: NUDIX hydrolase [Bacteroidota bacterium]|jgi:8-oxo-dGTP diphosphatase